MSVLRKFCNIYFSAFGFQHVELILELRNAKIAQKLALQLL